MPKVAEGPLNLTSVPQKIEIQTQSFPVPRIEEGLNLHNGAINNRRVPILSTEQTTNIKIFMHQEVPGKPKLPCRFLRSVND